MSVDTAPLNGRVYPPAVTDLIPKVAELAAATGEIPSRNRIMKEFKVGSPKATAVREALLGADVELTTEPDLTVEPQVLPAEVDAQVSAQPALVGHPAPAEPPA